MESSPPIDIFVGLQTIPSWLLSSRANVRFDWQDEGQNKIQTTLEILKINTAIFVHLN